MDLINSFIQQSSVVNLLVTALLFLFLFLVITIFINRFFTLSRLISNEKDSLDSLLISPDNSLSASSLLYRCFHSKHKDRSLNICLYNSERSATKGLTWLSIISTLSPFVGLFGTVVGILQAFSTFSEGVSLSTIAPAISEALIATAMGILVAIPAYAATLIVKRKAYELVSILKSEIELLES